MKNQKGFSLIELLIVVAIILIIAAIAIPSLMRARIAANESAMVGDIRTVITAQATFNGVTGGYTTLALLETPNTPAPAAGTIPLLDHVIATGVAKGGYNRAMVTGGGISTNLLVAGFDGFCYGGTPTTIGRTGIRSFAGDASGIVVQNAAGTTCCLAAGTNDPACIPI